MTCMEVAGIKRVLFKILLPALLIALWLNVAYYPSLKDGQLDYFTYWIIAGLPFGIKAIGGIFYPVGFDLQGGVAVLAMNVVLGGAAWWIHSDIQNTLYYQRNHRVYYI